MSSTGILAAAASALPIPGASAVAGALGSASNIISLADPGKLRDAARINRRDFFLNAAKAGSVTAARYLIAGEANVYTDKEKGEYRDGVAELQNGPAAYTETLANARALGPMWDSAVGNGDMTAVGQIIATELGRALNVPTGTLAVNQQSAITSWASQFGFAIRQDASNAVAQAAAAIGTSAAQAIAPAGSAAKGNVLIPTNKSTLVIVGVVVLGLLYFAMRKH